MDEQQTYSAKAEARKQVQDYLRRGAEQGSSEASAFAVQQYAWTMPWTEAIGHGIEAENKIHELYRSARIAFIEDDPNFDIESRKEDIYTQVPAHLWNRAFRSGSEQELQEIMQWAQDEKFSQAVLAEYGIVGDVAKGLASVFDVDMALGFLKGGSLLGPLAQQGTVMATSGRGRRLGSIAYGAGMGLEAGVVNEVGNRLLQSDYESAGLPAAMLSGLAFGTALGTVLPWHKMANDRTKEIMQNAILRKQTSADYPDLPTVAAASESATTIKPRAAQEAAEEAVEETADDVADVVDPIKPGIAVDASVGAARVTGYKGKIQTYGPDLNTATSDLTMSSMEKLDEIGWRYDAPPATRAAAIVNKIEDTLNMLPWLRTDQDVLLMSNSPTAQLFGLLALESSSGRHRVVNNTSAVLKQAYQARISRNVALETAAFTDWAKATGVKRTLVNRQRFQREAADAMDEWFITGVEPKMHPATKAYVDAMNEDFKDALEILQKAGNAGSANLTWTPGWRPYRWSSRKIIDLGNQGVSNEQIIDGLALGYAKANPTWSAKMNKVVAKALLSRAYAMDAGIDTNLIGVLQQDGRARLTELLVNNGATAKEAKSFLDSIEGQMHERGKAKILKHRNAIDPRVTIPGTNYRIADLLEDDLSAINMQYARQAAGLAALAEGTGGLIRSRADFDHLKNAIKNETQVFGGEPITDATLDHIYAHFSGGRLNADANIWVKRAVHLSNLALLNQMGITQLAETGVMIAYNGFDSYVDASKMMKRILDDAKLPPNKRDPQIKQGLQELERLGVPIQGEHNLLRSDRMLDDYKAVPDLSAIRASDHELWDEIRKFGNEAFTDGGKVDQGLQKLTRLQGYISGFYMVRHAQTMLYTRAYLQNFGKLMDGTKTFSPARLKDMGFVDDATTKRVQDAWKHVTYTDIDGRRVVENLNLDKWDPAAVTDFQSIMQRSVAQSIQAGLAGETSAWMSTTAGVLLANLRTFTLTGLKKQTLRHARIADPVATASVLYGLPLAGMVYSARQILNNREENLTTENIVKGAIGYSNLTAPIPMLSDPFTALLGMDDFQFGMFGARDFTGNYEFVPGIPAIDTLNRLGNLPASVWALGTGQGRANDISNAQAIPIVGNMLGMNAIFNGIKDNIREERVQERKAARQKARQEAREQEATLVSPENINPSNVLERL